MSEKLFGVSPKLIVPSSSAKFDVYLAHDDGHVLYTRIGEYFTAEATLRLEAQDAPNVFIPASQEKAFVDYLERHLNAILDNPAIPIPERADVWSKTATRLSKSLFEEQLPPSVFKKRFERFQKLIDHSVQFFTTKGALRELSGLISKGFDIYHHGLSVSVLTACLLMTYEDMDDDVLLSACGGAILHDIGKMRLSPELMKFDPDRMSYKQRVEWETHPVLGVQVSATIPIGPEAIHCVLFHHERQDGQGFPSRTPGSGVPLYAKAVSLCDRYDNLTRNQHYRLGIKPYEALRIIRKDRGFCDNDTFARFVKMLSDAEIVTE